MIAAKIKLLPAECNAVARDAIWKKRVNTEMTAARLYPSRWSFYVESYKQLFSDLRRRLPTEMIREDTLPPHLHLPPLTPIEKLVKVEPSPKPYPQTTTRHIGWRSSKRVHKLEIYGEYTRPKGCIYKTFNWPIDAI